MLQGQHKGERGHRRKIHLEGQPYLLPEVKVKSNRTERLETGRGHGRQARSTKSLGRGALVSWFGNLPGPSRTSSSLFSAVFTEKALPHTIFPFPNTFAVSRKLPLFYQRVACNPSTWRNLCGLRSLVPPSRLPAGSPRLLPRHTVLLLRFAF